MGTSRAVLGLAFALAMSAPALAAEAVVPFAVRTTAGGVTQRTELLVTNTQPSLTQALTLRWRSSDGGRGRVRMLELAPGESRRVEGLAPPGRRGSVLFDAAPGLAVSARLVTDRPGGAASSVGLPVLRAATAARPGTRLILQNLESPAGEIGGGIGLVNLSNREAQCDVTLRDSNGRSASSLQLTVAAGAQRLVDDLFALSGTAAPALALATVSCNREFWAFATVVEAGGDDLRIVEPAFDAVGVPATSHSLTGSPNHSTFFRLPGEFLVSTTSNYNWQYDMRFDASTTFRKVLLDFDVYVAGWEADSEKYFHCLFWLNRGSRWANMMGYLNALGTRYKTRLEVNDPTYIRQSNNNSVWPGGTFHVHYEMDFVEGWIWYRITNGNDTVIEKWFATAASSFTTSYNFIQFGSQWPAEGPEGRTLGWRFSNFVAEYVP